MKRHTKMFVSLFLYLTGSLLTFQSSFASDDICYHILGLKDTVIRQSVLSERIFGIERDINEIRNIDSVLNIIYSNKYSFSDINDLSSCLQKHSDYRFIGRNIDIFTLSIVGRVDFKDLFSSEKIKIWSMLSEVDYTNDRVEMIELVNAVKAFRNDDSIDKLESIYYSLSDKELIVKRHVISSLHFIGGDYARRIVLKIRNADDNDIIESDIVDALNNW